MLKSLLFVLLLAPSLAFAVPGTCPSGANYLQSSTGSLVTLSTLGVTGCYYIAANGSDSNAGTSEASPWLHAPGMTGCSGNCVSLTPTGGEAFILRGGDSWHFNGRNTPIGLPWSWTWNGSSGSPIYIGVDPSWYSGSSWARPVLEGDNPHSTAAVSSCAYPDGGNSYFTDAESENYLIVDDLEAAGMCWNTAGESPTYFQGNLSTTNVTWERIYVHGWTRAKNCTGSGCATGAAAFAGDSHSTAGQNDQFVEDVCDGSDSETDEMSCILWDAYDIHFSVITNLAQGIVANNCHAIHDNLITAINEAFSSSGDHSNGYECNSEWNGNNLFYNNVISNNNVAVTTWHDPSPGYTDYFFNNVLYNNLSEGFDIDTSGGGTIYLYNNTLADTDTVGANSSWKGNLDNNFLIGSTSINGAPSSNANTISMSDSKATTAGYTSGSAYAYQPTSANCNEETGVTCPVGAGGNLTGSWPNGYATSDTTYACSYNSTSHTVSCPARKVNARPSSGVWDVGAFQFSSSNATLQSITLTPANPSIVTNGTEQFTATGNYSNGSTENLNDTAAWTSSDTSVAAISNSGLATGLETGTSTISAASGSVTGSTGLTVTAPTLQSITVTPANSSVGIGGTQQYTATGTYSNGTTQNLTSSVIWSSSNTGTATISSAGLAKGVAAGTTTISASSGSVSGKIGLTVTAAMLQSISVTPANASIAAGSNEQYTATGTYSNGTTQNITGSVTWNSSNTAAATISSAGLAKGVAAGATTISATSGSVTGSTGLTVTATLQSITVTPANASIASGSNQQYTATGTYSNGTTQNITGSVTWSSSDTAAATISSGGLAKGVAAGTTTISAASGSVSGTTSLTVTAAMLQSITVIPANSSVGIGGTQQYTATGTYSNGTTQNITGSVTWSSSDTAAATISSGGLAKGVAAGTTTISAASGSVSGTTSLTVTAAIAATLQSISVTPANTSIAAGSNEQYTASGTYSDGTTQNLTSSVTWSSSNTAAATISSTGLAQGVAAGTTTISAASGSVSGTTSLTVTAGVSASASFTLAATPSTLTVANGGSGTETVTATPADGYTGTIALGLDFGGTDSILQNLCGSFRSSQTSIVVTNANPASATFTLDTNASDCASSADIARTGFHPLTQFMAGSGTESNLSKKGRAPKRPNPLRPGLSLAGLALIGYFGRRSRKLRKMASVLMLVLVAYGVSACGISTPTPGSAPPPGTYTITITGQDSVNANLTSSTTFTLVIQ